MNLIVYFFCAFGLAWILGHSKISLPMRVWLYTRAKSNNLRFALAAQFALSLIECVGCLGFHEGWIAYLLGVRLLDAGLCSIAVLALATTASNLIIGRFVGVVD